MGSPKPQPYDPTSPGGGVLYASAGGVNPASGVSGVELSDGPWTIIQQWLTIQYHRVPSVSVSAQNLDLDSASQAYNNFASHIACVFGATVSHTSSTDWYPLGEYQQPHTFEILPVSSDHLGNSYGDLNGSCLGPMGSIETKMPFYHRYPQTTTEAALGDDFFYGSSGIRGSNFQYGMIFPDSSSTGSDQYEGMTDFEGWQNPAAPGQFQQSNSRTFAKYSTGINPYHLGGPYTVDQENMLPIWNFIYSVGSAVKQERCEAIPSLRDTFWGGAFNEPWLLIGNGWYDPNRHDFS